MGPILPCLAMGTPLGIQERGHLGLPGSSGMFLRPVHCPCPLGSHSWKAAWGRVHGDWWPMLLARLPVPGRDAEFHRQRRPLGTARESLGMDSHHACSLGQRAGVGLAGGLCSVDSLQGHRGVGGSACGSQVSLC